MRPVLERIGMPDRNSRGRLRVIGGALRGRRIDTLPGESIRPTGDRVREALFDILGNQVHDSVFLDIYAGTGAIGIEALSRGAREVVFIENDPAAADRIRKNLSLAGAASARVRVIDRDPAQAVALLQREQRKFDFIYLDPPYTGGELERGLLVVGGSGVLSAAAIVIGEHDAHTLPPRCPPLSAYRTARYGRAALTFYAIADAAAPR